METFQEDEGLLVEVEANIQPITRTVLRVRLSISPNFRWNDKVHGKSHEPFWIWVEDPDNDHMYHHEYFLLTRYILNSDWLIQYSTNL